MSLRDIAKRLVITTGAKRGQHLSPATVGRDHRAVSGLRPKRTWRRGVLCRLTDPGGAAGGLAATALCAMCGGLAAGEGRHPRLDSEDTMRDAYHEELVDQ
jgi:hypothetical protein